MAAYGALVSVMQIMDQLHRHPHPPISLHKQHVESLTANLTSLQKFLEGYNPRVSYSSEADPLESRIVEAAYAAEDVIENYIVDQIHGQSTDDGGKISSTQFYQGMEKVIGEMDVIKVEVMEKKMQGVQIKMQLTADAASLRSSSTTAQKVTTMVGLDEVSYEMLDKITGGERVRQIIPIVGMGGLGKTTLARNIYADPLVKEYFDICAWSTISQVHNTRKILAEILDQVDKESEKDLSEGELGLKLYRHLMGKRYFIVMDDMWNIEAWDKIRNFFPESENGSRVVVTTRLSKLASKFNYSDALDMKFLDEASSWDLFSKTVFGEGIFPPELEDLGKEILKGCRGLPLSIVVVGGLLSKTEATQEKWKVIEENLSSVVNLEGDGSCLQILYTSYNNLPVHIKPCFLYMGVFFEDDDIPVRFLIPLWIAEGLIKPVDGKSLEEVGEEYLKELIGRNLVLVEECNDFGKVVICKVHDLVRDLALREGEKDKFLCELKQSNDDGESRSRGITSGQRRVTNCFKEENSSSALVLESVEGATASSLVRTLIGKFPAGTLSLPSFRLLRVYMADPEEGSGDDEHTEEEILIRPVNLRFLVLDVEQQHSLSRILSSSASLMWNLQTLYFDDSGEYFVLDIWKMPLLRHVISDDEGILGLPNPPPVSGDEVVLKNLHTLDGVRNLKLSEEVLKRIPDIRILELCYQEEEEPESDPEPESGSEEEGEGEEEEPESEPEPESGSEGEGEGEGTDYCLNNLHRLNKLQDLRLTRYGVDAPSIQELILPNSLKQLTLVGTNLPWEDMASKIGCLPLLQILKLEDNAFVGSEWETVEGQFPSLVFLKINECDLADWITDNTHFPLLEHLVLYRLTSLREIPSCIGDIQTLRSIELEKCSDSAVESARTILAEQEEYDNQVLQIQFN